MPKFRKKPVVIEARQFTGEYDNAKEILTWMAHDSPIEADWYADIKKMTIHTLEGNMVADVGDWIIKGIHGEFYPCKPDIFEKNYDLVD